MIRFMTGLFVVMAAVGTLEANHEASLLWYGMLGLVGCAAMAWPVCDGTLTGDE